MSSRTSRRFLEHWINLMVLCDFWRHWKLSDIPKDLRHIDHHLTHLILTNHAPLWHTHRQYISWPTTFQHLLKSWAVDPTCIQYVQISVACAHGLVAPACAHPVVFKQDCLKLNLRFIAIHTYNTQHTTHNTQRTTHNTQHPSLIRVLPRLLPVQSPAFSARSRTLLPLCSKPQPLPLLCPLRASPNTI